MEKTHTKLAAVISGLGWLSRFVLFVLTGGFAFPHVCTEGMKLKELAVTPAAHPAR